MAIWLVAVTRDWRRTTTDQKPRQAHQYAQQRCRAGRGEGHLAGARHALNPARPLSDRFGRLPLFHVKQPTNHSSSCFN